MNTLADTPDLRYPIGRFEHDGPVTESDRERWIGQVEALPEQMRRAVENLSDAQLDTPYRPGGWTIRQVVHHVPDSHVNCYVRFKWALTEDEPVIKPYDEVGWANLADYGAPVGPSLDFLAILHAKWVTLMHSMSDAQWARHFVHPESGPTKLAWSVGSYAWHGRHHLAHITAAVEREGY